MTKKAGGWFRESERHSLASRGIKTGQRQESRVPKIARSKGRHGPASSNLSIYDYRQAYEEGQILHLRSEYEVRRSPDVMKELRNLAQGNLVNYDKLWEMLTAGQGNPTLPWKKFYESERSNYEYLEALGDYPNESWQLKVYTKQSDSPVWGEWKQFSSAQEATDAGWKAVDRGKGKYRTEVTKIEEG